MSKEIISTNLAPAAIGTYSQAVKVDNTIYVSGQIALEPASMQLQNETIEMEIEQVFKNVHAVLVAAGADLADIVKLHIYLTDLAHFSIVNDIMAQLFKEPYPARAAIGVAALPRKVRVEVDAIAVLPKK